MNNPEDNTKFHRTQEEVRNVLKLTTIQESTLNNTTQVIYSSTAACSNDHLKLLELDDHLMEMINKGETLSFQGQKDQAAVLCSPYRTYEIKDAETSNSLLLIPNLKFAGNTKSSEHEDRVLEEKSVRGIVHKYFEVHECKPKLGNLLTILESSSFKGKEYESIIDPESLYDWHKLQNEVQASEDELFEALPKYLIVNINGYYRHISFEVEAKYVTMMLDLFDENSWDIDEVDKETTKEYLNDYIPEPVFECLFNHYTEPSSKTKDGELKLYRYNEKKICNILAKVLLAASPVTEYNSFMESWRIGTPEKIDPKLEYLDGIALIVWNGSKGRKEVVSFPETNLPQNLHDRLYELFSVKEKWTLEEITPYLTNLTTRAMTINALLTKHTRFSINNNVKYYCSKYGK